jgi:hypothetical protein
VPEISGDFELHLTVSERGGGRLAAFAEEHGLKASFIVLDKGEFAAQPMVTVRGSGTLTEQYPLARQWNDKLIEAGMDPVRIKVEAAPWNAGVPRTHEEAHTEPPERYFEHHVKVLLPDTDGIAALGELVRPHGAKLSRNARRRRTDGSHERFVTQRCRYTCRPWAKEQLDKLVDAVRSAGHEVLDVEEEYVVADTAINLDRGWLDWTEQRRLEATGRFPSTFLPIPADPRIRQLGTFDPALKQHVAAFRAGEPVFEDRSLGRRWRVARRQAMLHVLAVLAATSWGEHVVLRGSLLLWHWFGADAREPNDLDFVVPPGRDIGGLYDELVQGLTDNPGPGVRAADVVAEDIWTYERADGRRLVFPFQSGELPPGTVQLDFVLDEALPVPASPVLLDGLSRPVLAATPELSLAWKLLWLYSDWYPQGKDLYDAVLLAEHTAISPGLITQVLAEVEDVDEQFSVDGIQAWAVDWQNFQDEYPELLGDADTWKRRLANALRPNYEG